jgi:replication fork clamp-binding protein CrfC
MCSRYVSDSRTIILCVLPANADMTTSDGLQMARQVDPKGVRTIGVVTKIDIMDKGTSAKRMIEGKDVQLRLGFIGIKNRSQQDIIDRMPVRLALEKEALYFSTHPIYSTMQQNCLGSGNLIKKLGKILFTHIKHSLPEITNEIKSKVKETEDDLKDLGPTMPLDETQKMQLLWNMITDFIQTYKNTISGRYDSKRIQSNAGGKSDLSGGAKIKMSMYGLYSEFDGYKACDEY